MRATRSLVLALFAPLALSVAPRQASAHGVRTASIRVDETGPTRALVRWSTPVPSPGAGLVLPDDCTATPVEELAGDDRSVFALECPGGIAGHQIGAHGLGPVVTEATVFVRFRDGREASHLLTSEQPAWALPLEEGAFQVARSYVRSGLLHISGGADHLLFLTLLVLVQRKVRRVLIAETAFTISHSIAYAATALGWVHVRPAPVEACIALSLVLLALDVRAEPSDRPWWEGAGAALVFGLVHGLGFAGGLREAGLPDAHAAVALLGFGAGIEIGQVAFLAAVLALVAWLARLRAFPALVAASTTLIGGIATAWLIDRSLQCLAS